MEVNSSVHICRCLQGKGLILHVFEDQSPLPKTNGDLRLINQPQSYYFIIKCCEN